MTRLAFLSPSNAEPAVPVVSPIRHAVAGGVVDVSHLGKLELRGRLDGLEPGIGDVLLRLAPGRALLVTEGSPAEAAERLAGASGVRGYDVTAALGAFEVEGEDLMRRLTDLDLDRLPAVGSVVRGTRAVIESLGAGRYRLYVAAELGHYLVEVVLDNLAGLGR